MDRATPMQEVAARAVHGSADAPADERRAAPVACAGDTRNEPSESAILAPKGVASAVVAIVVARREVPE